MSSSGAGASGLDAELALLSGPGLVARLRTTVRRADYDAAARVLGDRDRRLAEAEAKLAEALTGLADMGAEVQVLKEQYLKLKAKKSRGHSSGAIAAAARRAGRSAEEPGPEGDTIDLCSSSDDEDDELEEGEFRPAGAAGVSCKRQEPAASKGDEGRRAGLSCQQQESASKGGEEELTPAGVSCKRKAPASACSPDDDDRIPLCQRKAFVSACSPDDDDDNVPLSQLFVKKPRRAHPVANGEPNKGRGDAQANYAGILGARPVISPVNRGIPGALTERVVGRPDDPKVAAFVQGTGNAQSGENGGLSRAIPSPPPTGFTEGNSPRKNCSKPDGSEGQARIGEQDRPVAGPENDAPVQVRTPKGTDTVRRIVASARVGAETAIKHTYSSTNGTISAVLKPIEGQQKPIGGVHKKKVLLETNGTGNKASIVLKDTREQGKPNGQLLNTNVFSRTDGIREQGSKLSPSPSRVDTHGARPMASDKPVSTALQPKNQLALHSEQMSVESSLPSAVTRHWKSSSDVLHSCLGNTMICMQAACALHRLKKFTTQPAVGGIDKYDAHRVAKLAEFLLDGNLKGPLKRTAGDLQKYDATGPDFLERILLQCSEQLFTIYKNKDDQYFR